MTLKEKLKEDMKIALKAGDAATRSLMGMVLSAVKNKEIEKKSELNDEEVVAVIASEVKKRKDSIIQFEKGGRLELAADEQKEIDALMIYMPAQLSDDVVREAVVRHGQNQRPSGRFKSEPIRKGRISQIKYSKIQSIGPLRALLTFVV